MVNGPAPQTDIYTGHPVRSRPPRPWTEKECLLLINLVLRGHGAKTICDEFKGLKRKPSAVLRQVEFLMFTESANLAGTERALFVLMGRARADSTVAGGYRMAGRPVRAQDVIGAANVVLKNFDRAPIAYPCCGKVAAA